MKRQKPSLSKKTDAPQTWFWSPDWQAKEREASEDIADGRTAQFESDKALLKTLER
jgi:antitoxin PrlF